MLRWVHIRQYCAVSGETPDAVEKLTQNSHRLYALDALRLAAALAVLMHHWLKSTPKDLRSLAAFPEWLSWHGGYVGVAVFFMISGLVILMSAEKVDARGFVFARIVRLYPAFWICCTLTYFTCINTKASTDQAGYLVSLTMFPAAFGHLPVDGVYWTLAVEARFYLAVALMLAMNRRGQIPALMVAWMCAGMLVDDPRVRAAFGLDWAPYFVIGCACYLLRQRRTWARWGMLALATGIAADLAGDKAMQHARMYGISADPVLLAGVIVGAVGLILAVSQGWVRLPRSRVVMAMGAASYPLYLLHSSIGWKALGLFGSDALGYFMVLAGMLFLSWAVAHVFEPRGQRLLRGVLWRNIKVTK